MTDYRQPETAEEYQALVDNLIVATAEERDIFNRFLNQTLTGEEFIDCRCFELFVKIGFYIPNVPSMKAMLRSYADFGIEAEPLKGSCWHTATMVAINYDNVQYAVDDRGEYFLHNKKRSIEHAINHYQLLSTYYHTHIKEIYNYLKTKTTDDIWVMAGGGAQLQAFFGTKDGYIAILYLDMDDYVSLDVDDAEKAEIINKKKYSLSVQFSHNNHYFDKCPLKNFKIQKSDCER